ncbi:MAG TPA: [FeFe] hydrogenase H-cluster maturation GTPase HydF, partial [Thermoanaerobaculia bacterium]|nr:[FeFe] hydrogenase H-cluster maturation GTPase HydF [Thermoanaerobaculia bacterium]
MKSTPKGLRLQIGLFGRRNVGKSSLLNALAGQEVAIVSPVAGTTTDPAEKPFELLPVGPVLFIDTGGLDDEGSLGEERIERTRRVLERTDLGLVIAVGGVWGELEEEIVAASAARGTPVIAVLNQADRVPPDEALAGRLAARGLAVVCTSAVTREGIAELREAIVRAAPADLVHTPALLGDLVRPGEAVVLVVPIDKEAPKGRLILPQVQAIRDLLDHDAWCLVVKERELGAALAALRQPPALVVTDSQAFREVAAATPPEVPMTSFSILLARAKGDLAEMVRGAAAIGRLAPGDRVLVVDSCSHHPVEDDIARVK